MKYSILVLGASISISLFIRICCAVETNALYEGKSERGKVFTNVGSNSNNYEVNPEELLSEHGEDSYMKYLKLSLMNSIRKRGGRDPLQDPRSEERVNEIVSEWMEDMEESKKRWSESNTQLEEEIEEHRGDALAAKIKSTLGMDYFNSHICGLTEPPPPPDPSRPIREIGEIITELPEGCDYDNSTLIMTCKDKNVTDLPPLPSKLNSLNLSETKIRDIPLHAFVNVSINQISISNNAIEHIDPWTFNGVSDLTTLIINNNKLTHLNYEMYIGLNETTTLDLRYNRINLELYKDCPLIDPVDSIRIVFPKLRVLFLSGNPLIIIPKQMFAGLRGSPLTTLYLENCYLNWIHPEAFTYVTELRVLLLTGNPGIVYSLENVLQHLTKLETLGLNKMGLSIFPKPILGRLTQLKHLHLDDNTFAKISHDDLSDLINLEDLYLENCGILHIHDNAFDSNSKLTNLFLKNNRLTQIPANFPPSLNNLLISRNDNDFTKCTSESFQSLTNIKHLELANVRINTLSKDNPFDRLISLEKLFLKGCNIDNIEDGAFQDLSKLTLLTLEGNPLSQISPGVFDGLESLTSLDMSNCNLTLMSPTSTSAFKSLKKLNTLKLSGNQITHLSSELFTCISSLSSLHLSGNKIQSWNTRIFPDRIPTVFNISSRTAAQPYSFVVELSKGSLRVLTDAMIEDFLRMTQIDLSDNVFLCDQGACKLRDLINASTVVPKQVWVNHNEYYCIDSGTSKYHKIVSVTDAICKSNVVPGGDGIGDIEDGNGDGSSPESSSTVTVILIIAGSVCLVLIVVILLAYRNRVHLRYFLFKVKFNVMPVNGGRKAKLSTMESELRYDYDVFLSYHNEDSKFIADVFLPEIEQQESKLDLDGMNTEPKAELFLIENDKMSIMKHSQGPSKASSVDSRSSQNKKKFRVCLHERDFVAGVPITENIMDCVDRSRKMIIFVSKKYMESQWCTFEMNLVYHRLVESRRKSFALVLLDDIPPGLRTKVLNYLMITKTYLQWPGMNGLDDDKTSFWRRLRAFLQSGD